MAIIQDCLNFSDHCLQCNMSSTKGLLHRHLGEADESLPVTPTAFLGMNFHTLLSQPDTVTISSYFINLESSSAAEVYDIITTGRLWMLIITSCDYLTSSQLVMIFWQQIIGRRVKMLQWRGLSLSPNVLPWM